MEKLIEYIENEIKILEDRSATPYSFSLRSIYADTGKHAAYRDILNFIEKNKEEQLAERAETNDDTKYALLEQKIIELESRFAEIQTKIEINIDRIYSSECR